MPSHWVSIVIIFNVIVLRRMFKYAQHCRVSK